MQFHLRKRLGYIAEAKIKSDRVDSKAIAELIRLDALPLAYFPIGENAKLREKVRRAYLMRTRVRLRVKIKSVLNLRGPQEAKLGYGGSAQTHIHKYDTSIAPAYNRIAEKGGKKIVTVAAARRLLMCSYSVLKNKKAVL